MEKKTKYKDEMMKEKDMEAMVEWKIDANLAETEVYHQFYKNFSLS